MGCCCISDDPNGCSDSCDEYCPCISMYPKMCTAFLSLIFAAIFAAVFGTYAFVALRISIFRFSWPIGWLVVVNASLLAIVVAVAILVLALLLWCTCSSEKKGRACKSFYLLGLTVSALAICVVMFGSVYMIYGASGENTSFASELESVWMNEVNDPNSTLACRVQKQLTCRGFEEGDCQNGAETQNFSRCGIVCRAEDVEGGKPEFGIVLFPGCRERMSRFYIQWNAVLLAGSTVACILVLVAFFVTCTSVSFDDEK